MFEGSSPPLLVLFRGCFAVCCGGRKFLETCFSSRLGTSKEGTSFGKSTAQLRARIPTAPFCTHESQHAGVTRCGISDWVAISVCLWNCIRVPLPNIANPNPRIESKQWHRDGRDLFNMEHLSMTFHEGKGHDGASLALILASTAKKEREHFRMPPCRQGVANNAPSNTHKCF